MPGLSEVFIGRFDGVDVEVPLVPEEDLKKAWQSLEVAMADALQIAHDRILYFHEQEAQQPREHAQNGQRADPCSAFPCLLCCQSVLLWDRL